MTYQQQSNFFVTYEDPMKTWHNGLCESIRCPFKSIMEDPASSQGEAVSAETWHPGQCANIKCPFTDMIYCPDFTRCFSIGYSIRDSRDIRIAYEEKLIQSIRTGALPGFDFSSIVLDIIMSESKAERAELKSRLPWFSGSHFADRRSKETLYNTNFIILDIDWQEHISNEEFVKLAERALRTLDNSLFVIFRSPSHRGLKLLYKVDTVIDDSHFLHAQRFLKEDLVNKLGWVVDRNAEGIAQVHYLSYDPLIKINENCRRLNWELIPESKSAIDFAAPASLPQSLSTHSELMEKFGTACAVVEFMMCVSAIEYRDWVLIGFALKSTLGEAGRSLFLKFSDHPSYNDTSEELEYKWKSFDSVRSIGFGSLIHVARNYGWQQ